MASMMLTIADQKDSKASSNILTKDPGDLQDTWN